MAATPQEVLRAILGNPSEMAIVFGGVAEDARRASAAFENPFLKRVTPWAEYTFATTDPFRIGGEWMIHIDPDGEPIGV